MCVTFPAPVLQNAQAYWRAASLAAGEQVYASSAEAARQRRDLAVDGFGGLRREFEFSGVAALELFYQRALRLIQPKIDSWHERWERGAHATAERTGTQLRSLQQGRFDHLFDGRVYALPAPGDDRQMGMCGTLGLYLPEGVAS